MDFNKLYVVVATLTIILAVGFLCRKIGIIDDVASKRLSKLILMVGQPAMIIYSMANIEYTNENVTIAWVMLGLGFVFHILLAVLGFIIALPYKKVQDEKKISEFSFMFANCAFIGFPIFEALIPGVGLTVAIRDLFVGDNLSGALRSIEVVLFAIAIAGGYFLSAGIMGGIAI